MDDYFVRLGRKYFVVLLFKSHLFKQFIFLFRLHSFGDRLKHIPEGLYPPHIYAPPVRPSHTRNLDGGDIRHFKKNSKESQEVGTIFKMASLGGVRIIESDSRFRSELTGAKGALIIANFKKSGLV